MSVGSADARVVVEGWAEVSEQDREAYLALVKTVVEATSRRKGCIRFAVSEDISCRNRFHLVELWTDVECLDASRFGDENLAMLGKLVLLDIRDRKVTVHHVSGAEPG